MVVYDLGTLTNPRFIINFPTKRHWKGKSRIEDIELGLAALVHETRNLGIRSLAIPPLGCGLGGLNWNEVRPKIEHAFQAMPELTVLLFEPAGAPEAKAMAKDRSAPQMTFGRAALLGLMRRYLAAAMDPAITLLEVHKLMYFMQEAGAYLRLRFKKAPFGPYAENLRHVLSHIEGHFIQGYGDADDKPEKQIELISGSWKMAEAFLSNHPEAHNQFKRVADLIEGFETPFGMELLATVHWVATREAASTADEAIAATHSWSDRKRGFTKEQIRTAWDTLHHRGGFLG